MKRYIYGIPARLNNRRGIMQYFQNNEFLTYATGKIKLWMSYVMQNNETCQAQSHYLYFKCQSFCLTRRCTIYNTRVFFFINHERNGREREMFYLTTHSTDFIYGYMASDIWLRTILIVRKETRCRHIGYSYRLTARVLLYAPSH